MISFAKFTGRLARLGLWLSGIGLVLMTAMIAAQVWWRYVLNDSLIWTEPLSILVMGWFILLGAAVGIREGYHLSFEVLLHVLPQRVRLVLYSVSDIVVTGFGAGMVFYGWKLAAKTATTTLPSLGVSGAVSFLPVIFGGALVVLFSVERLLRRAAGLPTARFGETVDQ